MSARADVNAASARGRTPLFAAAAKGANDVVQLLLAAGADVSTADSDGRTALHAAVEAGFPQVVYLLLAAGADVHAAESHGMTPLHAAVDKGQGDIAQLLLAAGARVDAAQGGSWTPLHTATTHGHLEIVQLLLHAGANPQLRGDGQHNTLHTAAWQGHEFIAQLLLEAWGQPQIPAAELVAAANVAAQNQHMGTVARLARELRRLYPAEAQQVFQDQTPALAARLVTAVLDGWSSDASRFEGQMAAARKREEDTAKAAAEVQPAAPVLRAISLMSPPVTKQCAQQPVPEGLTGRADVGATGGPSTPQEGGRGKGVGLRGKALAKAEAAAAAEAKEVAAAMTAATAACSGLWLSSKSAKSRRG
jgi:hypothetical protein